MTENDFPLLNRIVVSTIGRMAWEALDGNPPAAITGVTSRGLFIRLDERQMIFLSTEAHHGPLTLNLSGDPALLSGLAAGEPAMITDEGLVFPAHELEVYARNALPWQSPAPPCGVLPAGRIRALLRETVEHLLAAREDPTSSPGLLLNLRRLLAREAQEQDGGDVFLTILKRLARALWDGQPGAAVAALQQSLGRGSGLTPSGDDLAQGFLLALQRWGKDLQVGVTLEALRTPAVESAYRQTTTLSANLIHCAAAGQADERLVAALDGLVTGALPPTVCAAYFRSWGSSSGVDALAGMAVVLLAARHSS